MTVWIGQATGDERGKIKGGKAGDQKGNEVKISKYLHNSSYAKWSHVFRAKSETTAKKLAYAMVAACYNNKIGYDQKQRSTFYDQAKKVGWDPAKVKTACETTCAQVVGVCLEYAGIKTKRSLWTGSLLPLLKKKSNLVCYTSSDYTTKSTLLKPGDILITKNRHTAMVVAVGDQPSSAANYYKKLFGTNSSSSSSASSRTSSKTIKNTSTSSSSSVTAYYASQVDLSKIKHMKAIDIIAADWNKLYKYYGGNYGAKATSIKNYHNITPPTILTHYTQMLDVLIQQLERVTSPSENTSYVHFLNNKNGLLEYITPKGRNTNNIYYKAKTSSLSLQKWMNDLYNDIYLKKMAAQYYVESQKYYIPVLKTSSYLQGLYKDICTGYNSNLSALYTQMKGYVDDHTQTFDTNDQLKIINQQIDNIQTNIYNLNQDLYKDYGEKTSLDNELKKYQKILENLLATKNNFKQNNFSDTYTYWNKKIIQEPNLLNFWLEFSNSNEMNNYTIKNIGRKAYGATNEQVKSIYYREVPQVIYYNTSNINKTKTGYVYLQINNMDTLFTNSSQGLSAKNVIDDLLYQHSYCSQQLNLNIVPIHYLEPNTRILIYNEKTKVNNEYIINKISNPISYNGNMTINATQVAERLY